MSIFHFGKNKSADETAAPAPEKTEAEQSPAGEQAAPEQAPEAPAAEVRSYTPPILGQIPEPDNAELEEAVMAFKWTGADAQQEAMLEKLKAADLLIPAQVLGQDGTDPAHPDAVHMVPRFLSDGKGHYMLPMFTGKKHAPAEMKDSMLRLNFMQCCDLACRNPQEPRGLVLNPHSDNITLPAAMVLGILGRKPGEAPARPKAELANIDPSILPEGLLDTVREQAAKYPPVKNIWLKGLIEPKSGKAIALFLFEADMTPDDARNAFQAVAEEVKKVYTYPVAFGQVTPQMMPQLKDTLPVYHKA